MRAIVLLSHPWPHTVSPFYVPWELTFSSASLWLFCQCVWPMAGPIRSDWNRMWGWGDGPVSSQLPSCPGPQSGIGRGLPFQGLILTRALGRTRSRYSFQFPLFSNPGATSASLVNSLKLTHTSVNNSCNSLQKHIWLCLLLLLGSVLKCFLVLFWANQSRGWDKGFKSFSKAFENL